MKFEARNPKFEIGIPTNQSRFEVDPRGSSISAQGRDQRERTLGCGLPSRRTLKGFSMITIVSPSRSLCSILL